MLHIKEESQETYEKFRSQGTLPVVWGGVDDYYPLPIAFRNLPLTVGYARDSFMDRQVYGFAPNQASIAIPTSDATFLHNVKALFTDWRFIGEPLTHNPRENPVSHVSVRGDVTARYVSDLQSGDWLAYTHAYTHGCYPYAEKGYVIPDKTRGQSSTITYSCDNLVEFFEGVPDLDWDITTTLPSGTKYIYALEDFHYLIRGDMIELLSIYHGRIDHSSNPYYGSSVIVVRSLFYLDNAKFTNGSVALNECFDLTYRSDFHAEPWSYAHADGYKAYGDYDMTDFTNYMGRLSPYATYSGGYRAIELNPMVLDTVPQVSEMIGFEPVYHHTGHLFGGNDYSLLNFRKLSDSMARDCFNCIGLAASAALSDSIGNFGINQYENVEGLVSLFGLVDVVKLLKDARRLRPNMNAVRGALDLLANARLTYSYALSPAANDVKTIREGAREFLHVWFSNGAFKMTKIKSDPIILDVPVEIMQPFCCEVELNCAISGSFNPDTVLPLLLPVDALGLLPRISSLWEVLPFSFVLDNILDVGKSLELAENTILQSAAFTTDYSVGSYKVTWNLTDETTPSEAMWASLEEGGLEYRAYHRFVFDNVPQIGPSRVLSSTIGSRLPSDLTTYGALAWKLFT